MYDPITICFIVLDLFLQTFSFSFVSSLEKFL